MSAGDGKGTSRPRIDSYQVHTACPIPRTRRGADQEPEAAHRPLAEPGAADRRHPRRESGRDQPDVRHELRLTGFGRRREQQDDPASVTSATTVTDR